MALHEKIRQARLEAGLSQKALCGNTITRNMLSLIENGNAKPSMATLSYIAGRLGKPVSYFLDEAVMVSANQGVVCSSREAYAQKDYDRAQQLLAGYATPDAVFDDEFYFLTALTQIALSENAIAQDKRIYALTLLDKAQEALKHTIYATDALSRRIVLLRYAAKPEQASVLEPHLPDLSQELYLRAQSQLQRGRPLEAAAILDAMQSDAALWQLLRGQCALQMQKYQEATRYYHAVEEIYPQQALSALERCYRELENYELAYKYACKQREISDKL